MKANDTSNATRVATTGENRDLATLPNTPTVGGVGVDVQIPHISYGTETVLRDVSFQLPAGQFTTLLGPSGVGKSTILKLLCGILPSPDDCQIQPSDNAPLKGRIAYMDQKDLLLPWASSLDNLLIAARLRGEEPDTEKARHLLEAVGLEDKADSLPSALSGGMRQRVALARTLMEDAPLVLLDEPFSALDAISRHRLQELASEMLHGRTVLMITHDPMESLRVSDQILVLYGINGKLQTINEVPGKPVRDITDPGLKPIYESILSFLNLETGGIK